ncbi:MAG TPA: serpin family protein [Gemmataceae bacterium]|nr:serpin family protein [Gemmataceae bacterium]
MTDLVQGNNAFAVDLYREIRTQPGNLFFSPESISTALAMTYAGARGDTATEMAKTLHFTLPPKKLHVAMGGLLHALNAAHDDYQLKVANALWGQQGYNFLDDFLTLTRDKYGSELNQVDFKTSANAARQTINSWVEQQTENKIKDLIAPGVLTKDTRLVLTNAIYFKGAWETQFRKEDTKKEDFHVSATQTVEAPLMHCTGEFNYLANETFQALEIPYKDKELSMIVFLPKDANGLVALEQSMNAENMEQWLGRLRPASKVILTMPKFRITREFGLADTLGKMGIKQAFGPGADFSGMASRKTALRDGNLYISAFVHKAYVDVTEEGSEAAAATTVVMNSARFVRIASPSPPIFRADRPFLFVIRDNKSGSILFMGRVTNPAVI